VKACFVHREQILLARRYASAGTIVMALCLSVSVTSRCSVKADGWTELVLGIKASCDISYTVLECNSAICKKRQILPPGTLSETLPGGVDRRNVLST